MFHLLNDKNGMKNFINLKIENNPVNEIDLKKPRSIYRLLTGGTTAAYHCKTPHDAPVILLDQEEH